MAYINQIPTTMTGEYMSPIDGTVIYSGSNLLTASGFPFTVDDTNCHIISAKVKNVSGSWASYSNGYGGVNITCSSNAISLTGVTTPFLSNDLAYVVYIKQQAKGYDSTSDSNKMIISGADWGSKTIDPVPIIASAQTVTTSFADLGASFEIPSQGYKTLGIWIDITLNQMTGIQIIALAKHTVAGTDEYYRCVAQTTPSVVLLTNEVFQLPDVTGKYYIPLKLDNTHPYIQLQIKALIDAGTNSIINSCYYTLGY